MPGRNLTRLAVADSYYHVYNRGINRRKIFVDEEDYNFFTKLFSRHLGHKQSTDVIGRPYVWLGDGVSILAYCWMPTHFHLLVHQKEEDGLARLMRSVCTAYTMYFNKKYKRRGPLFENRYRAIIVSDDVYLQHISRYIHLNPREYSKWQHSSLPKYLNGAGQEWTKPEKILEYFAVPTDYADFVADYEDLQRGFETIKHELADH